MSSKEVEHSSIDLRLTRVDRVYRPGEAVEGDVVISAKGGWSHQGVKLAVSGQIKLQVSSRSVGVFDTLTNLKPLVQLEEEVEVCGAGKVPDGVTTLPFSFKLPKEGLRESYHGVYINVTYTIDCDVERGVMKKALHRDTEFILEVPGAPSSDNSPHPFSITPDKLDNVRDSARSSIPKFKISGRLFGKVWPLSQPLTGEVMVEESEAPVKAIELQLVRVESVSHPETSNVVREATEIQSIQIADGDISRDLAIPLYMIFPRIFTCPTLAVGSFRVEFEVNLIVEFDDGYMITERFPIELYRGR